MRTRLTCILLLLAFPMAQADEQLRATQEELRRRNVYFGEIDGRQSSELGEALRRYQRRKGFAASGRTDNETLRSLGLRSRDPSEPAPKELSWPEEPVLRSDVKIEAAAAAKEISQESGISIASLLPIAEKNGSPNRRLSATTPPSQSAAGAPAGAGPGGSGPGYRVNPALRAPQRLEAAALDGLVKGYFKAASAGDLTAELRYLADRVDYLGHGLLDRRIVEHTLKSYYQLWPKHSYKLAGPLEYRRDAGRGVIAVTCTVDFTVKRGRTVVRGRTMNRIVFDAATADPRIVSIQEKRVRR